MVPARPECLYRGGSKVVRYIWASVKRRRADYPRVRPLTVNSDGLLFSVN